MVLSPEDPGRLNRLYRDGAFIAETNTWPAWIDRQLEGGRTYSYQVRAVDSSGNESGASAAATATTNAFPDAPINFARCGSATGNAGCTYTSSVAADPTNPDTNGNSLTDGTRGELVYSPAWQSRNSVPAYSFTIDLGAAKTITEITAPGSKTSATASCSRRA